MNEKLQKSNKLQSLSKYKVFFLLVPVIIQPVTSSLIKYFAVSMDEFTLSNILIDWFYYVILVLFAMRIFCWQIALSFYDLSKAYTVQSLRYVFLLIISYMVFNESISLSNILGTVLISYGVVLMYKAE